MKKISVILIALVLICTSAFAGMSVTGGAGFGLNFDTKKDAHLATLGTTGTSVEYVPAMLVGFDYETDYGFSAYADTTFGFVSGRNKATEFKAVLGDEKINVYQIGLNGGVGYTLHFDPFTVMAGVGLDTKIMFNTVASTSSFQKDKLALLGIGARIKGVYDIDAAWGVSFQINPAFDFVTIKSDIQPKNSSLFTCAAYAGAVYKF